MVGLSYVNNDSSFIVKNQKQIFHNLNFLCKKKCLFTAHFGKSDESFITTILDIDEKNNTLELDYGPKEYLNKKILASPDAVFKTEFSGIKVEFSGKKLSKTRNSGQPAFIMPLPESMIWLEHRKFYRIRSPLSAPALCRVFLTEENMFEFDLLDISITGFSILNNCSEISDQLIPTAQFDNCQLLLPDMGEGRVSFVIRNKMAHVANKPDKTQRIGCEFLSITPSFESTIQRYMQMIEREYRKKS